MKLGCWFMLVLSWSCAGLKLVGPAHDQLKPDCCCCHHCRAWRAWFQQPAPPTSRLFAHFRLSGSDALPRWRRPAPPPLSFKNPLQKPTGDLTDTTSIFFTVYAFKRMNHSRLGIALCPEKSRRRVWNKLKHV